MVEILFIFHKKVCFLVVLKQPIGQNYSDSVWG